LKTTDKVNIAKMDTGNSVFLVRIDKFCYKGDMLKAGRRCD